MQAMRGGLLVVQDIVNAGLHTPCQSVLAASQVMGGGQFPYLIRLAVTVVLVITGAAGPSVESQAHAVCVTEAMLPGAIDIAFVVSHAVYGNFVKTFMPGVIHVCLGVEPAV